MSHVREELDRRLSVVRRSVEAGDSAATASWPRIVVVVDEVAELAIRDLGDDRAALPPNWRPRGGSVRSSGSGDRRTSTSSPGPRDRMPQRALHGRTDQ
ncbi:MAG: hypothetical protein ACYCX9_05755 [Candidatus Dormibacteria bacterium]